MDIENVKGELFSDWCEFEQQVKIFKKFTTLTNIEENEKFPINCSLFKVILNDEININDLVKEYNNNINDSSIELSVKTIINKWIIEFPYQIIFNYMKTQANSISEIINEINEKEEIKTVIFVGGYCANEMLVNLIKCNLNKINIYLQPSNPSLAIMEGAVLFGIEPSTINIRKAKYTIGESIIDKWKEKIHSEKGEKFFYKEFGEWMCRNCFNKFIEINQDLKYGEKISQKSLLFKNQKNARMIYYKTKKPDPVFTFEEGSIKIGECQLNIEKDYDNLEDRIIETTMKFGGTFIDVTSYHLKSGKSVKTTLTFD